MTCERCGATLAIGDYPFCRGTASAHMPSKVRVKPDTIVGGFWAENAWREPRYFDSQRQYERALDESGLMLKPPKTKGAQGLLDPQTLANAEALVARQAARQKTHVVTERTLDETIVVQADAC